MDLNQLLQIEGLRTEIFHWLKPHEASIACQACKLFLEFFQHDDYWKTKIDDDLCSSVPSQQLIMNPCIRTFAQDRFGVALCKRVDWLFTLNFKHSLTVFSEDFPLPSLWRYIYEVLILIDRPQLSEDGCLANFIQIVTSRNERKYGVDSNHYMYKRLLLVQRKLFVIYPFLRGLRPYLSHDSSLASYFSEDPSQVYQEKLLNSSRTTSFINCSTLFTFEMNSLVIRLVTSNATGGGGRYEATIMEIGLFQSSNTVQSVLYAVSSESPNMRLIAVEQMTWTNFLASALPFQTCVNYLGFKELSMTEGRPLVPRFINNPYDTILPKQPTSKSFENVVAVCTKLILIQIGTNYFPEALIQDLDNLFREKSKKRNSRTAVACVERLLRRILRRILEDKMTEYTQMFTQQRDTELESFTNSAYLTNSDSSFIWEIRKSLNGDSDAIPPYHIDNYRHGLTPTLFRFPVEVKSAVSYGRYSFFYPLAPHLGMYKHTKEHISRTVKFGSRYPPGFYAWASALLIPISKLVVYHLIQATSNMEQEVEREKIFKILQEIDDIAKLFEMSPFKSRLASDKVFLGGQLSTL